MKGKAKTEYQREYMRRRRAGEQTAKLDAADELRQQLARVQALARKYMRKCHEMALEIAELKKRVAKAARQKKDR